MKQLSLLSTVAALGLAAGAAHADQVFNDDVIVDGSLCVGFDCANGISFGSDTVILKENNLRLFFDDTSASASFPSNDWRLIANDSTNGGANQFSIQDATASREVFIVEAGAPANGLVISSSGDVGIKTANPVVDIHAVEGNTPTLRLEQDGSDGFTPQTWDVAGNEVNFFVRDATSGSTLPFRIMSGGAPSSSLLIDGDGNVGLGAGTSPSASLHVRRSNGTTRLRVEEINTTSSARTVGEFVNNGRPDIVLANSGTAKEWSIGGGTKLIFKSGAIGSDPSAKVTQFQVFDTGDATLTGTLTTGGGTCGGGCDLVFTEGYDLPSIKEHADKMWKLGYLPNVGPTIENAPINVSDKLGRMLNELEHAHIYIAQQEEKISLLTDQMKAMQAKIDALAD